MNYIKQLNELYPTLDYKPLNAEAIAIYFCLLQIANKTGWIDEFKVANTVLMSKCNIDKQKLIRARNKLISQGYILYRKGKNQAEMPIYSIVKLYSDTANNTPNNTASNTTDDTPNNTADDTTNDTNNKQNKTKQNKTIKEENIKKRDEIKNIYNSTCTNLPKVQKLTDNRKKAIDKFLKEFTVEQFEQICKKANESNFLKGENDRNWKADFDFLMRVDKATSVLEGKYNNSDTSILTTNKYDYKGDDTL